ncbi:hypothetical protein P3S67_006699 [Capsicum chacoense]|nr:hypothetical protein FXO38_04850 [Capsicum annuum]
MEARVQKWGIFFLMEAPTTSPADWVLNVSFRRILLQLRSRIAALYSISSSVPQLHVLEIYNAKKFFSPFSLSIDELHTLET